MFYHSKAGTQFNVIKNAEKTLGSLLFILRVFRNEKLSFTSLIFKRENVDSFSNTLKDFQGKVTYDNLGRVHLPTSYYRPAFLSLLANKYDSSSIASHVTDLNQTLVDKDKSSTVIISYGGPDYSPTHCVNSLFYYRLFKRLNLNFMTAYMYIARYSTFNPIKHLWSPMSNKLSGAMFKSKLDGEAWTNHQFYKVGYQKTILEKRNEDSLINQLKILNTIGLAHCLMGLK